MKGKTITLQWRNLADFFHGKVTALVMVQADLSASLGREPCEIMRGCQATQIQGLPTK